MRSPVGVFCGTVTSNKIGALGPACQDCTTSVTVIFCAGTIKCRVIYCPVEVNSEFQKPSPSVYLYSISAPAGRNKETEYRPSGNAVSTGIRSATVLNPPFKSEKVLPS